MPPAESPQAQLTDCSICGCCRMVAQAEGCDGVTLWPCHHFVPHGAGDTLPAQPAGFDSHGLVWGGGELKNHLIQPPATAGTPLLNQAAGSPIQAGLDVPTLGHPRLLWETLSCVSVLPLYQYSLFIWAKRALGGNLTSPHCSVILGSGSAPVLLLRGGVRQDPPTCPDFLLSTQGTNPTLLSTHPPLRHPIPLLNTWEAPPAPSQLGRRV